MAFYNGGTFPAQYNGALFFSDYSRSCIWVMFAGANGVPDPATRQPFVTEAGGPVDLQVGPGGDLFYADAEHGLDPAHPRALQQPRSHRRRDRHAHERAGPAAGELQRHRRRRDPDGDPLTYAWDLDGDGAFDDSTASQPSFTYTTGGTYTVRLRVTDPGGLSGTDSVTITVGHPADRRRSTTPTAGTTWRWARSSRSPAPPRERAAATCRPAG